MRSERTYSLVARFWSIAFLLVALLFLLLPGQLADSLNTLAGILGLSGAIEAPTANLWYVLTFSLMGLLAVLASMSAKRPSNSTYFSAIVTAKTISVVGFLLLMVDHGTVWSLCAAADGFVALTLILTFRGAEKQGITGFSRKDILQRPHYDVWFGKLDIAPGKAFWFRYTILNGKKQEASTWAILFDSGSITTGKKTYPLNCLAPSNSIVIPDARNLCRFEGLEQVFHIGDQHLDTRNAIGHARKVSWDLSFIDHGKRFEFVPASVKALGVAKSTYNDCFMDLSFSGSIRVGPQTIELSNRPGMIGHIHGKQSAHEWAWAHCNNFEGTDHVVFEALSARIRLGSKVSGPLTSMVLCVDDKTFAFSSVKILLGTESVFGRGKWSFKAESKEATLAGTAISPEQVALVEYTDTDDSNLWCHNSKLADLSLTLTDHSTGTTEAFVAKGTAAFELVGRKRPDRHVDL